MDTEDCPWCGESVEFDMWDQFVTCRSCQKECDVIVGETSLSDGDEMLTVELTKAGS
jgi:hypothetical protein